MRLEYIDKLDSSDRTHVFQEYNNMVDSFNKMVDLVDELYGRLAKQSQRIRDIEEYLINNNDNIIPF